MKKKFYALVMIFLIVIESISCVYADPEVGNISDTSYSHYNNDGTTYTSWRSKYNDSYVYLNPVLGPAIYYNVRGSYYASGNGDSRSSTWLLSNANVYSLTNYVYESEDNYAKLKLDSNGYTPTYTSGYWSPDSVNTYVVKN